MYQNIPSPVGFGWELNDDDSYVISWNTVNPAPDEVLDLMFCSCPKKCVADSCPCVQNNLKCTDACVKQNCENFVETLDEDYSSEEDESDID